MNNNLKSGGVILTQESHLSVSNSQFMSNSGGYHHANSIHRHSSSKHNFTLSIGDSLFYNNTGRQLGAVRIDLSSQCEQFYFQSVTFKKNIVTEGSGGGLSFRSDIQSIATKRVC